MEHDLCVCSYNEYKIVTLDALCSNQSGVSEDSLREFSMMFK